MQKKEMSIIYRTIIHNKKNPTENSVLNFNRHIHLFIYILYGINTQSKKKRIRQGIR